MEKNKQQVCPLGNWGLRLAAILLLTVAWNASAQTNQDAEEQIRRTLQLEEQRREAERRERDAQQRIHTTLPADELEIPVLDLPSEHCFTVHHIHVEGVTLFPSRKIASLTDPLIDTCVGIAEINRLVSRVTNLYIDAGYVTSRAYIPPQNLGSGELIIKVVEGYVESLRIEGGPDRLIATALPGLVGKPLNLRQIEQGLDQINRLQSSNATIQFIPGQELGATEVVISFRRTQKTSISVGYNNSGQENTGLYKATVNLSHDNLLGINDFIYLNVQTNAGSQGEGKASDSYAFHYSVPWGYWSFALNANQFEYGNLVHGSATTFETSGTSEVFSLGVDRLLGRDQNSKTILKTVLKHQSSENFIDDIRLDTSSRDSVTVSMDLSRERYLAGGKVLLAAIGYERGLTSRDGIERMDGVDAPEGKFDKYRFEIGLSGSAHWFDRFWRWRTDLRGQHSDDTLFPSDGFSIGSLYSVRGFKESSLSGDSGAYWRNELSLVSFPFAWAPRVRIEPFFGLDAGYVRSGNSLAGGAGGLRVAGNNLSLNLTYGKPLHKPDELSAESYAFDFSLNFYKRW